MVDLYVELCKICELLAVSINNLVFTAIAALMLKHVNALRVHTNSALHISPELSNMFITTYAAFKMKWFSRSDFPASINASLARTNA